MTDMGWDRRRDCTHNDDNNNNNNNNNKQANEGKQQSK
jgi:hypothetical protein